MMILIFPPVAKPCEPPAGVALLSGALKAHGLPCEVYDASIDALLWLIRTPVLPKDSWTKRALAHREENILGLKDPALYRNNDRYRQKVFDLNRLLSAAVPSDRFRITLADYSDHLLSPVKSKDLITSAVSFAENPFYPFFESHVRPRIENHPGPYVGISLCYLNQALVSFALAGWIKNRFPEKKIVMGGGLVSSWMSQPGFDDPFDGIIDIMIRGEGEEPLVKLLGATYNPSNPILPDYDFVGWEQYLAPGKILPFRASIGCYWSKCRFCPESAEGRPYKSGRADHVMEHLDVLVRQVEPEYVHFIDNAVTPAFLRALCRKKPGFEWYGFVRFTRELTDETFCRELRASGCRMLNLGLESGDQNVLDLMNKGTDLTLATKALNALHRAGILTYVYLLFGTAFEDEAAAYRTLEYVSRNQSVMDFLNLAIFNLPRFSQDADHLETGHFYEGDLSLYMTFTHPMGWHRKKVRQFLERRFKKEPSIAAIVRKNPPYFTSNHAMFFNANKEQS